MRKAQIASIDLFIAVTIFLILLGVVLHAWNIYNLRLQDNIEYEKMQLKAFHVSDLLVKSPGYPFAWEDSGPAEVIGLASSDRVLSPEKVSAFIAMDYDESKQMLKLSPYEYSFRIKQLSNNLTSSSGLPMAGELSVTAERYVTYNDEKAIVQITIWE
ncbi:MAG: hypothetical protein KJ955_03545 [Nanoarchaeota archaeon]|nr:hypothetical protein [Nanoarchaeota archaeon]